MTTSERTSQTVARMIEQRNKVNHQPIRLMIKIDGRQQILPSVDGFVSGAEPLHTEYCGLITVVPDVANSVNIHNGGNLAEFHDTLVVAHNQEARDAYYLNGKYSPSDPNSSLTLTSRPQITIM